MGNPGSFHGKGDAYEAWLPKTGDETSPEGENPLDRLQKEIAEKQRRKRESDERAKDSLDNAPRPVTKKSKEKLKKRTSKDIFGNPETQDYYIENVKDALEKMGEDGLHKFIREHQSYGKANFRTWNKDLYEALGFIPDEAYLGRSDRHTQRRVSAAAQHVLVDFYNTDVFQLTQKKVNPWVFIDGKLGPYTVSVLADYWTWKYGKKSGLTPNPPGHTSLDSNTYKPGSAAYQSYQEAQRYREIQINASETPIEVSIGAAESLKVLKQEVDSQNN